MAYVYSLTSICNGPSEQKTVAEPQPVRQLAQPDPATEHPEQEGATANGRRTPSLNENTVTLLICR